MVRRLLERVRVPDELRLAERRPGEGDAEGRGLWVEVRIGFVYAGTVQVGEESRRHDDARVSGAGGRVGAEVGREQDGIELLAFADPLVGDEPVTLLRHRPGVQGVEATGPGELEVERTVRLVIARIVAWPCVEEVGTSGDGLSVLAGRLRVPRVEEDKVSRAW